MHQQGTQIGIAALGDAQLPYSSSCACLPRHQPQPGSKFSPRLEACRIPHRSNCSCRRHQSNTWDIRNHLAGRRFGQCSLKSPLDQCDFVVQTLHPRPLFPQCLNQDSRQLLVKGRHDGRKRFAQSQVAYRQGMAELQQQSPNGVRLHMPEFKQLSSHSMQGQNALLIFGLDRNGLHFGLLHRRPNSACIRCIGLVAQHKRSHCFGREQSDGMTQLLQLARPPMGSIHHTPPSPPLLAYAARSEARLRCVAA